MVFLNELRFSDAVIILRKPFWSFFCLRAIENDALWPSRIQRVDCGVENVQVSDAMVEVRVESDGSFLVCSSTRNKILVGRFQVRVSSFLLHVLCIGRHRLAQHCNEQP